MGNGISKGSSPISGTPAKLILLDGELREFFYPVKVSDLTTRTADSFICNSDQMEFDEFFSAMKEEEELRQGQLYFELPLAWLNRRLQAQDMASLAGKANEALAMNDHQGMCGCYHAAAKRPVVDSLVFSNEEYVRLKPPEDLILDGPACDIRFLLEKKAEIAGGVRKRRTRNFAAKLNVILEE